MEISEYKLDLINKIIELQDISMFEKIKDILSKKTNESSINDKKEIIPIELYFKLIEQSENDFLNGKITKHSDFEKESLQW